MSIKVGNTSFADNAFKGKSFKEFKDKMKRIPLAGYRGSMEDLFKLLGGKVTKAKKEDDNIRETE